MTGAPRRADSVKRSSVGAAPPPRPGRAPNACRSPSGRRPDAAPLLGADSTGVAGSVKSGAGLPAPSGAVMGPGVARPASSRDAAAAGSGLVEPGDDVDLRELAREVRLFEP